MNNYDDDNLDSVYKKCEEFDNKKSWTKIDDQMENLDWLEDVQLCIEADVMVEEHKQGTPKCTDDHPAEECVVPKIIRAVDCILEEYKNSGVIKFKDRQVLQYYVAFSYLGIIIY